MSAFATSYIPTTSASATRAADAVSLATSAFPFSATLATLYANGTLRGSGTTFWAALSNAAFGSRFGLYDDGSANNVGYMFNGSSSFVFSVTPTPYVGRDADVKLAFAGQNGDFAAVSNGGTPDTDSSADYFSGVNSLYIGYAASAGLQGAKHIKQVMYLPRRMSNADMQTLTGA